MLRPAVFLDRDNTIMHNDGDLGDPREVVLIQGAPSAIASLRGLGYRIVVVTNQGGVARGKYTEEDVDKVHQRISELAKAKTSGAKIDAYYHCPFHPKGTVPEYTREHPDRKPQPGMLLRAAEDLDLDLAESWMIGDQPRDTQAGAAAGTRTILLHDDATRLSHLDPAELADELNVPEDALPEVIVRTLIEAVRVIAQHRKPEPTGETGPSVKPGKDRGRMWDPARVADAQRPPEDNAPAEEEDAPREPTKPFRPWGAPTDEPVEEPIAERLRRKRQQGKRPSAPSDHDAPPAAPANDTPEPGNTTEEESPTPPSAAPPPAPHEAPQNTPPASPTPAPSDTDRLLRQLVQELRQQRTGITDVGPLQITAIGLQAIAAICLLGGLTMGTGGTGVFWRWLFAGLMIQIATVAVLLFGRK